MHVISLTHPVAIHCTFDGSFCIVVPSVAFSFQVRNWVIIFSIRFSAPFDSSRYVFFSIPLGCLGLIMKNPVNLFFCRLK